MNMNIYTFDICSTPNFDQATKLPTRPPLARITTTTTSALLLYILIVSYYILSYNLSIQLVYTIQCYKPILCTYCVFGCSLPESVDHDPMRNTYYMLI